MRTRTLTLLSLLAAACGGETQPGEVTPPTETTEVVRPSRVDSLTLARTDVALPAELAQVSQLYVATLGAQTLVGTSAGLYELGVDGLTLIDATPVTGLTTLDGVGIVVATGAGVSVWNGTLEPSPLSDSLSSMDVAALGRRGTELWLGTTGELYRFDENQLDAFVDVGGANAIHTYQGSGRLVLETAAGSHTGLREATDGTWSSQAFDEIALDHVLPGAGDRIFGEKDGALYERAQVDADTIAWRAVALSTDEADEGVTDAEALALDGVTGALWVVLGADVRRITGSTVDVLARPADIQTPSALGVSNDGALWLAANGTLSRFGHDGPDVTWATDIQPFAENNCTRCHKDLGIARPLETYEQWVNEVDQIIEEVAAGRMPQDGLALVGGSAELIRRWKDGGLKE